MSERHNTIPTDAAFILDATGAVSALKTQLPSQPNAPFAYPDGGAYGYGYGYGGGYGDGSAARPRTNYQYAAAYQASVWVKRAVDLIADKTAEMIEAGGLVKKSTGQPVTKHPFNEFPLKTRRYFNKQDFWEAWVRSLMIYGEAYIERCYSNPTSPFDDRPAPLAFRVLPAVYCAPYVADGRVTHYTYQPPNGGAGYDHRLPPHKIVFDCFPNELDQFRGASKLDAVWTDLEADWNTARYMAYWLKNYARPGLVFVPDGFVSEKQFADAVQTVKEQQGPTNAGKNMILTGPFRPTVFESAKSPELQKIEESTLSRISGVYGVPVQYLRSNDTRFQLSQEVRTMLYQVTIIPLLRDMVMVINDTLLPFFDDSGKVEFRLNEQALAAQAEGSETIAKSKALEGDQARADLQLGVLDVDEYRAMRGYPPRAQVQPMPMQEPTTATPPPTAGQDAPDTPPTSTAPPVTTKGADGALDELRQWQAVALKNPNRALKFIPAHDSVIDLQAYIKTDLGLIQGADDYAAAVKDVMSAWRERIKSIAVTKQAFLTEFGTLLERGIDGDLRRKRYAQGLYNLIDKQAMNAYKQGLRDGGVEIDPAEQLPDDDLDTYNALLIDQRQYVDKFTQELYTASDAALEDYARRPEMWLNKSIMPFYYAGLNSADSNGVYEWGLGRREKHCVTCKTAAGQRHRMSEWSKRGLLPKANGLACGGFNCDCTIKRVRGKPRGSIDSIPLAVKTGDYQARPTSVGGHDHDKHAPVLVLPPAPDVGASSEGV